MTASNGQPSEADAGNGPHIKAHAKGRHSRIYRPWWAQVGSFAERQQLAEGAPLMRMATENQNLKGGRKCRSPTETGHRRCAEVRRPGAWAAPRRGWQPYPDRPGKQGNPGRRGTTGVRVRSDEVDRG